ncbi:MAG TPA: hypothetical protein VKT77_01085 [Chthonomonadaceae bacterium]|nr:hypothetical protein [Chthonomonadaceae bacterium]
MIGRNTTLLGGALLLTFLCAGTQANAAVHFRFIGGTWGHARHAGWHRWWGGPSIGFYWAPEPVYIVDGYDSPSYYYDSDFWYSRPEFGLSIDIGGDGYYLDRGFRGRERFREGDSFRDREFDRDRGRGSEFIGRDRGRSSDFISRDRGRSEFSSSEGGRSGYRISESAGVRGHESSGGRLESRGGSFSGGGRSSSGGGSRGGSFSGGGRSSSGGGGRSESRGGGEGRGGGRSR